MLIINLCLIFKSMQADKLIGRKATAAKGENFNRNLVRTKVILHIQLVYLSTVTN